jgi:hypothetical protein
MDDLDHRNLGVKLKLWHLQEDETGMVFWHPRGFAVYRVLENYVRRKMRRAGYAEVRTPQLLPKELWDRSGHWDKFGEHMFRVDDGELAMAQKIACPWHEQIFNKGLRSWRELPIRYAEFGACAAMSLPVRSTASYGRAPSSRTTRMYSAASRTWRAKSRASSPCWARPTATWFSRLRGGAGDAALRPRASSPMPIPIISLGTDARAAALPARRCQRQRRHLPLAGRDGSPHRWCRVRRKPIHSLVREKEVGQSCLRSNRETSQINGRTPLLG